MMKKNNKGVKNIIIKMSYFLLIFYFTKRVGKKMTKRVRHVALPKSKSKFLFLELPDDMMVYILKPYSVIDMATIFGILFVNRDCYEQFARCIPLLYAEGYNATIKRHSIVQPYKCLSPKIDVDYRMLQRYMPGLVYSLHVMTRDFIDGAGIREFYNLSKLTVNSMKSISIDDLQKMSRLTDLDLSFLRDGMYSHKPIEIELLTGLKTLCLTHNDVIPDYRLRQMTNLTSLNLCDNNTITDIGIGSLRQLKYLNINNNSNITSFGIYNMTGLTALEVERIYEFTGLLPTLRSLIIHKSHLNPRASDSRLPAGCELLLL